jgi:hypothetical protein
LVIAVAGKVDEPMAGQFATGWPDGRKRAIANAERRLAGMCATLGIAPTNAGELRHRLLDRSCAAVCEALEHGAGHAVLLIHSFRQRHSWRDEFAAFADSLNLELERGVAGWKPCRGIGLGLARVTDRPESR